MKALIIINKFANNNSYIHVCERFYDEFKKHNVEYDVVSSEEIPIVLGKDTNLKSYDFGLYLDKDKYLARLLENKGLRLFNNSRAIEICDDKMLTHIELSKFDIPQPLTIPGSLCYVKEGKYSEESLKKIEKELGYPLVFKECFGSLGSGVHLINDRKELTEISFQYIHKPHLFQEFIKTSYGKDYRVIVLNHKVVASMKRVSENDFRSNIELGGRAYKCDLDKKYIELAIKVSNVLNLDYCGVDLLIGQDNNPLVCEVNSNAFFNTIEKINNVNIAGLYVEYMVEVIKNGDNKTK